jgi:SiaC family regulatory phosphoprotein
MGVGVWFIYGQGRFIEKEIQRRKTICNFALSNSKHSFQTILFMTMIASSTSVGYIPDIYFDEQAGLLRIEGESYPEYAIEYFQPVCEKLRNFIAQQPQKELQAIFKMSYFNTSTSRRFFEIFSILNAHHKHGGKVSVKWYYKEDDIDVHDSGMDFSAQVAFDFQCVPL